MTLRQNDPRFGWIASTINTGIRAADADSVDELLARPNFDVAVINALFSRDTGAVAVYAVSGDTFETASSDRRDKRARVRHQKLRFAVGGVPDSNSASQSVQCVFFTRRTSGAPIEAADAKGWETMDPTHPLHGAVDTMLCEAPTLATLQALLQRVFLPLMEETGKAASHGGAPGAAAAAADGVDDSANMQLHSGIVSSVRRLNQHVGGFVSQVSAERTLPMPTNPILVGDSDAEIKAAAANDEIVKDIDATVSMWHAEISSALAQEPQKEGPLGEIEFWKEKYAALSGLHEQINSPKAKTILKVAEEAECNSAHSIRTTIIQLTRQHAEAKDNVKFLGTLDRHFRAIHSVTPESGTLQPIIDTMRSMMMALRMVWIISRYYCTEEKMSGLLEKIAQLVAKKVAQHIDHRTILSQPFGEAKRKIREGQQCLLKWKAEYTHVQAEINASEQQHWVFDNKRLFETTDYMADRCTELAEIVNVLEYYHTVLGSQLKAVLTDTTDIEKILKDVEKIKKPIETMSFDPFEKKAVHNWAMMYTNFNSSVATLDQQVSQFIQKIFDDELRSAESAFDLLQSFKALNSRGGENMLDIKKLLQTKADKILQQFLVEVNRVDAIFQAHQDAPPLTKNQPPIAGAIHWSAALYQRLKKPVLRFQDEDMLTTPIGKEVKKRYVDVARRLKEFATTRYEKWKEGVHTTVGEYLKWNILKRVEGTDTQDVYAVNFNEGLFETIKEAKYLDRLGFDVPSEALNVTLQDEAYHDYVDSLKQMLSMFNHELSLVGTAERAIMTRQIEKLTAVLRPGLQDLNWFSLGINEFIRKCNGEITEFRNLSREIRKHAAHIETNVVRRIATTVLVPSLSHFTSGPTVMELQQVADGIERFRLEALDGCVRAYMTAPQSLKAIEELVDPPTAGVARRAGKSATLKEYYAHWEMRIFKALQRMVFLSLTRFASLLGDSTSLARRTRPPLFKVALELLPSREGRFVPPPSEVKSTLDKAQASILESTKSFCRWMSGTCIDYTEGELQPAPAEEPQEFIFSFYSDVRAAPQVLKLQQQIPSRCIQPVLTWLKETADAEGELYKQIMLAEKQVHVDNQDKKKLPWLEYASKFQIYQKRKQEFLEKNSVRDYGCLHCDKTPFMHGVITHIDEWLNLESYHVNRRAKADIVKLDADITRFEEELRGRCDTIDDLKHVLEIIDEAQSRSLEMEQRYSEIEVKYDAMSRFGVRMEDRDAAYAQRRRWEAVLVDVKSVNVQLAPKKEKFRRQTQQEVSVFAREVKAALAEFRAKGPRHRGANLDDAVKNKNDWRESINKMGQQRAALAKAEKLFGLPITMYPTLQTLNEELALVETVLGLYEDFNTYLRRWSKLQWAEVRIDDMQKVTDEKVKAGRVMAKTHGQVAPFPEVQQFIANFHTSLPLLTKLKNPVLKARHWKDLMRVTKRQFNYDSITLEDLIAMELYRFSDEIDVVVLAAANEAKVEKDIKTIKDYWAVTEFIVSPYAPKGGAARVSVLGDTSEIQKFVDDHIMAMQGIAGVKWVAPFIDEVRIWERKLAVINDVIAVWVTVQHQWQHLESIFSGSADIAAQLPKETAKFLELDKRWVRIMNDVAATPNVDAACNSPDRLNDLKYIEEKLDECQKDLSNYLETKRCLFPRFFFISDDELLSILASSSPLAVQEHMLKMFDNSASLLFKGESETIQGVESQEGEVLTFESLVNPTGQPIEQWLNSVLAETRKTLRGILKAAVFYYPKMDRLEWVQRYHGMITLAGCKVWWTFEIEDAFAKVKKGKKSAVKDVAAKLSSQLMELVGEMDKDLTKQYRKKINTLIIVDVHGRDIVDRFVRDSVMDAREFDWESQLRFYWDKQSDTCIVRQCTGQFNYGYEFMGLNGRLVITPLTDRCFMTLTQALSFYLGGAPGGPAGTGKTESVKDLAKAMSLHCVVFNCGDGLDYKAMASIFSGLSQAGSWGCFDEFNRIELPVLSVVSEQLRSIQNALKNHLKRFTFMDKEINIDSAVGTFITMNPGYAGRVELPDNLKALFRPVVMVVPDMELIAENMLFSEGFTTARELAKKMVTLYSLARGQLSRQFHYDWGLRALKAVLVMAGQLKRGAPELSEKMVLMRALRDMNAPKFVAEDEPLFRGLLTDLFPGFDPTRVPQENLSKAAAKVLRDGGYMIDAKQIDKVVQLYETMQTRHTSMVVGPTGGGKSVVINTLKGAQEELRLPTKLFVINPKAQPTSVLYGSLDPMTRNWTDGIFSNIFRTINRPSTKEGADRERKYVIFDGDVDARWVEDLNSVMDDNKLLTLPNGERIRLHPTCSVLFEVGDLQYASPATVSRVGMVYLDPTNLGWAPYAFSWTAKRNKDEAEQLQELVAKYVPTLLAYVLDGMDDGQPVPQPKLVIPRTDLGMVRQLFTMLGTVLTSAQEPKALECLFIQSCVWSFGALVASDSDRARFDQFLKKTCGWQTQDNGEDLGRHIGAGTLPERRTLFDYYFDARELKWKPWNVLIDTYVRPQDGKFNSILVPTVDTARGMWLLDRIVLNRTPILFVGEAGTAKTVTIQSYLRALKTREKEMPKDGSLPLEEMIVEMNFSSRTTSLDAQRTLEDNVEKRTSTALGPPKGKRLIVFIDDVNMPKLDTSGTQQPVAFMKLLIAGGVWYDRKDLVLKSIADTQFVAAMAPPGGGRNALDPRFVALFSTFNIPFPAQESLRRIYEQILEDQYQSMAEDIRTAVPRLTSMTLSLYQKIVDSMPATPQNFHYVFNMRDLSRVYQGMYRATPEKFGDEQAVVRLWRNEVTRVFADRMSTDDDKQRVGRYIETLLAENFPHSRDFALQEPMLFGDFGDFEADSDKPRLHMYEDFGADFGIARQLLEQMLEEINTPVMRMDLVMFDMAVEHVLRIIRVLSMPRGNCLLVGVGGSGKQSLTRLAALVCQMSTFEISLSRGYNEDAFREDLKRLYFRCGVERQEVVFLFMDMHVKQEGFLELINNMLASGMVPALFTEEEKDPLYASVADEVAALGLAPSKDNKWSHFVARCRDNLHVVLAMTPSGDTLRTRCRNFPSLINNTTIDWFTKWPAQALGAVATKVLAQENLPDELREAITEHFVYAHMVADTQSVMFLQQLKRRNFVTPKNFLAFLATYSRLLNEKRADIDEVVRKLKVGLQRLQKASEDVVVMQTDLAAKEIDLTARTKANDEMLAETTALRTENQAREKEALEAEKELNVRDKEIEKDSAEANVALEAATPALRAAEDALQRLDGRKVGELANFNNPSDRVVSVARMICVLLDEPTTWEAARNRMTNRNAFLKSVTQYDLSSLTERKMREVNSIVNTPGAPRDVAEMERVSVAAAALFEWVLSLQKYWEVAKEVLPKQQKVARLRAEKDAMEKRLAVINNEITFRRETVQTLSMRLEQGSAEARKLQEETTIMQRRLNAAQRLINGFTSERQRWLVEMAELRESRVRLVGDCLVGAAYMSYLGAFTFAFRDETLTQHWIPDLERKGVPLTSPFRIQQLMTSEVEMSQWASDGLPMDELSVQNGILTVESTRGAPKDKKRQGKVRFPLCIDPQMQAVSWIKRKHADNSRFEVATFSDPDFLKRLEFCIQYGHPFLFENVDEFIDPIIDTILDPQFRYESGQKMIKVGDKDIAWDDNFRMYLCTKLSNPNYTAEVFGKTLVINYSVTQDGLESQLLNYVVASERADLQRQSEELVQTMAENRSQLKQLEESLIRELTLATGNILDNDELISTLENTKSSASEVTKKLAQAVETAKSTELSRQEYRPAARRGAILFFVMAQLSAINAMYEYALDAFLQDVFRVSLEKSETAFEIKDRLRNIIEYLNYCVYRYVCMGIFERHKLTFSLRMAIALMQDVDALPQAELDFFLRGCVLPLKDFPTNPCSFLTERQWNDVCKLAMTAPVFSALTTDVSANVDKWADWYGLDKPEEDGASIPCGYAETMSPFQRLCLLRCFRPDRVYIAVAQFISQLDVMGARFTVPPILRYPDVLKQSSCMSPIVCVVSPGANPTDEIIKLAEKLDMGGAKLKAISLGQGQGEEAMRLVDTGSVRGHWVLLQNCHLLASWMKELEKVLERRDANNKPHADFRLWLTTEPSADFPLGILQRSLKVVNEPPNGLKMNLKSTMSRVTEAQLEECPHPAFRPLVFTLAFFHAVVQERRKYGKIGWNVVYDFNETDFTVSMSLINTYLAKAHRSGDPIPWQTLRYLVGEAMYGGRVTDGFDRRIVTAYLEEYFGDFLFDTFQTFHFYKDEAVDYCLPSGSADLSRAVTRDAMVAHIDALPLENAPNVFGLHANAETGYLRNAAEEMWAGLVELMPRGSDGATQGASREATLTRLAADILAQIPAPFDRKMILRQQLERAAAAGHDSLQPTQVVLMQELERWNTLVNVIDSSLRSLQSALAGMIGMSSELDEVSTALSNGQLPAQWRRWAPATRKNLGRWLVHFQRRYQQFQQWVEAGEPNCLWLSGLMVPESYLSALVQITCRKYVWPLDKSSIVTRVTTYATAADVPARPKDGAYVTGLYLEGARWDTTHRRLAPQEKKVLIQELPVLEIIPQEASKLKHVGVYRTPVYVTRDRRNAAGVGFVFEADLSSDVHSSHWTLESVALCLNSDD